jgi:phosphatidylglycerol---prolipoprotein diacylglyceryl transferase
MHFPSPIAFWIGNWPIYWYGLAYSIGILTAYLYSQIFLRQFFPFLTSAFLEKFLGYAFAGIVIGGRLGHVFLYYPHYYWSHPFEILKVWKGGMSFHGGLVGFASVVFYFARQEKLPLLSLYDFFACSAPLGLFFGRLANFLNQELYGKKTHQPWGIVFPDVDSALRHPTPLYEAFGEGIVLFVLFNRCVRITCQRPGYLSGLFLFLYALIRIIIEFFKEPFDVYWIDGYPLLLGQIYSLPLMIMGVLLMWRSKNQTSNNAIHNTSIPGNLNNHFPQKHSEESIALQSFHDTEAQTGEPSLNNSDVDQPPH